MNTFFYNKKGTIIGLVLTFAGIISLGLFVQSCTSDYTDASSFSNTFTEQEKSQIFKLADKYGLDISLDNEISGKKPSMKEIEQEFQLFASVKGEYELIKKGDNKVIFQKKLPKPRLKSSAEQGSWGGTQDIYSGGASVSIAVGVSWDFSYTTHPSHYDVDVDGSVSHSTGSGDSWISNVLCNVTGADPLYVIAFSFKLHFQSDKYSWLKLTFNIGGNVTTGSVTSGGFSI